MAKNKGYIELEKSINERVGLYYEEYKKANEKNNEGILATSLYKICETNFFMNEELSYARNILSLKKEHRGGGEKLLDFLIDRIESFSINGTLLRDALRNGDTKKRLRKNLEKLYISNSQDIKPKYTDRSLYIYDSFKPENVLQTNLALTYSFYEKLQPNTLKEWDVMCVVSERGRIIDRLFDNTRYPKVNLESHQKIFLITADLGNSYKNDSEKNYPHHLVNNKKYYLPYFAHNHHMVIYLKKRNPKKPIKYDESSAKSKCGNYYFVRTNFFYKDGLANEIHPIVFEGEKIYESDHQVLLEIFSSYYLKSLTYMKDGMVSMIPDGKFIQDLEISILGKINKPS